MATLAQAAAPGWVRQHFSNWRLALVIAVVAIPGSIFLFPLEAAFWVSFGAVILVTATVVTWAWGRRPGPLLVAPALATLVVMNIFPLLWSLGLSFFHFRANRLSPPRFAGLNYFEKVIADPNVWDRLQTTAIVVVLTVGIQLIVGFLLALMFEREFPGRRILLMLVLTPMMLSFVAVGAFFRYYYEPTFGLLSQAVRLFTGEPYILLAFAGGRPRRHCLRRRVDVVSVRDAARPRGARERPEVPLRSGRDRPRVVVAAVPHHHPARTSGGSSSSPSSSGPSRRSSSSTSCS